MAKSTLIKTINWLEENGIIDDKASRGYRRASVLIPAYGEQAAAVPEVGTPAFLSLLNCWTCRGTGRHGFEGQYPQYLDVGNGIELAETCYRCDTLRWYTWNHQLRRDEYGYKASPRYQDSKVLDYTGRDYQQLTARMRLELEIYELYRQASTDLAQPAKTQLRIAPNRGA